MCGIAGKVDVDGRGRVASLALLGAMADALAHRGPDERGLYRDDRAGLAHTRLSIIDLEHGQQPMGDGIGSPWIVFNGEIYNHVELRLELQATGVLFRTRSDTEVILRAFAAWGGDCFRRFNGQWAVAIWSPTEGELVLARDPIGICPLYVHEHGGSVWFASEVKALFVDHEIARSFDPRGLEQTFRYWAPIAPINVFLGIEELRPGSYRTYRAGRCPSDVLFWKPSYPEAASTSSLSLDDATEQLDAKLGDATRLRMLRADVPVGAYLSGGLDSSLTAAMARNTTNDLRTFSLTFEDAEFDEREFQREMAGRLGTMHEEVLVTRQDIAQVFPEVINHTERPILRTAPAPLFQLSKLVRASGIKAVLTGEGADEMLAGYDIFREARIRAFWARRPDSKLRPMLLDRIYPYLSRSPTALRGMSHAFWKQGLERAGEPAFSHEPRWRTTAALQRFFSSDFAAAIDTAGPVDPLATLPGGFATWDRLSKAQYLEIVTLLSPYLISSQGDRMLMAHSVEGRFPFLDRDVIDFCMSLPPNYLLASLDEKHILKRVAADILPERIVRRKKQPYRAPDIAAFTADGRLPDYVEEMLSPQRIGDASIFDADAVAQLATKARRSTTDPRAAFSNSDNMAFVGVLSTQLLYNRFFCDRLAGGAKGVVRFESVIDHSSNPDQ